MKKVAILSTGHPPFDERIFDKIGKSLIKLGYEVKIIVTTDELDIEKDKIKITGKNFLKNSGSPFKKLKFLIKQLKEFNPELIICSEPFPIISAAIFALIQNSKIPAKIIYDVTEWYPENVYLKRKGLKRFFLFIAGHLINFIATNLSDFLFVGEETKLARYRKYAPKKPYSIISYYPILDYYQQSTQMFDGNKIIFGYDGVISVSRGLEIIYNVLKRLLETKNYEIEFILAGRFENEKEKLYIDLFNEIGINLKYYEWTDYQNFSKYLEQVHICFDIRPPNKIYERSLPIKIFDYMALGKCIVASNYEPIKQVFEIANCGILVNPLSIDEIVSKITFLLENKNLIYQYGLNGRMAVEKFFNWKICEEELKRVLNLLKV
jgi:glycosyltransferase involved in cell wall biosynthesis